MSKSGKQPSHSPGLYETLIMDLYEKQLQQNLLNHQQSQRVYNEIVQIGKSKIDEEFHHRVKTLEAERRIHKSSLINKSHMIKSQLRFKMCQQVFDSVLEQIHHHIQADQEDYCLILIKLIVEGALRMFEPELCIRCLPHHIVIIERVLEDAKEVFSSVMKEQTGRDYEINLKISTQNALKERIVMRTDGSDLSKKKEDEECIGGVILADTSGNITYKNTIDARLNILKEISLPMLRTELWPSYSQPGN